MKIAALYNMLCSLYGIEPIADIERFILSSPEPSDVLVGNVVADREALLIRETDDGVELGLFISPNVMSKLETENPLAYPDEFGCAAEGVSHFVYMTDRIPREISVTKLELELQAEVDKFILMHVLAAKSSGSVPFDFFATQFETHSFHPDLTDDDRTRYHDASKYAAKYCHYLLKRYFNPMRISELLPEVRGFFRMGLKEKIARLTP